MKNFLNPKRLSETINLQQLASDPKYSVFVAASAGSGKTKVLRDRFLRLLLEGNSQEKIMCLTFTKVAAKEMQKRIFDELSKWVFLSDNDLKQTLFELLGKNLSQEKIIKARTLFAQIIDNIDDLKINTIHSFCQNLIQQFPLEADISPNFEVIDPIIENKILAEAKLEIIKKAQNNNILKEKIINISEKLNENSFEEVIFSLISKKEKLFSLKDKFINLELIEQEIYRILEIEQNLSEQNILLELVNGCQKLNISSFFTIWEQNKETKSLAENFVKNPNRENFNQFVDFFLTQKGQIRVYLEKFIIKYLPSWLEDLDKIIINIAKTKSYIGAIDVVQYSRDLLFISYEILDKYQNIKQKNNFLTYEDLIIKTKNLLQSSSDAGWIKYKLNGFVDHILVDESQDTNDSQWQIIHAITEEFFAGDDEKNRTIFIVGDQKQSIYSFQGSQPNILAQQGAFYRKQVLQSGNDFKNIELRNSFRSLPVILKVVDKTFLGKKYQESSENSILIHNAIKDKFAGRVELWPIFHQEKTAKKQDNFSWNLDFSAKQKIKSAELLAQAITKTIKNWQEKGKILSHLGRHMEYGDVMILIKKRTGGLEDILVKALETEGIPVNKGRINLKSHLIFQDLLAIIKFLLNAQDDLNLSSLLKSPIFNISQKDLLQICQVKNERNISLFQALKHQEEFSFIVKILQQIRFEFNDDPFGIYELFLYILDDLKFRQKFWDEFGQKADIIIEQFILILRQKLDDGNLEKFISEIESDFTLNVDESVGENKVKISTIHSAKGLESPIVFLADCSHNSRSIFNIAKERILWQENLPLWLVNDQNSTIKTLKQQLREQNYQEYLRLLYVAMTRAEAELYITGFSDDGKYDPTSWYSLILEVMKKSANSAKFDFNDVLVNSEVAENLQREILSLGQDHVFQNRKESKIILDEQISLKSKDQISSDSIRDKISTIEKPEKIIYPSLVDKTIDDNSSGENFKKGAVIHKLLEYQIKLKQFDELWAVDFLKKFCLTSEENREILQRSQRAIAGKYLQRLLKLRHRSEIAIIAKDDNGDIISAVVDLVIFAKKQILILDFKSDTDRRNESKYQKQIAIYCRYFQKAYSDKIVKGKIFWV